MSQLGLTVPSWFVAGWGEPQAGGFATVGQLLRPFPQYFTISTSCCLENLGQSTYNAHLLASDTRGGKTPEEVLARVRLDSEANDVEMCVAL